METATINYLRVHFDPPQPTPETVTTVAHYIIEVEDDDIPEDFYAAMIESRRGATLPLWFVMRMPNWLCRIAFWIKGLRKK